MAAGLGLEEQNIELFREAINKSALNLNPDDFKSSEEVIGILPSSEIDIELLNLLESFEPYGEANSRPLFLIKDAEVLELKTFGKEGTHSKIILRQFAYEKNSIELIQFKKVIDMPSEKKLTCSYRITKNEFNSRVSAQLIINKIYNN